MFEIGDKFGENYKVIDWRASSGTPIGLPLAPYRYRSFVYILENVHNKKRVVAKTVIPISNKSSPFLFFPFETEIQVTLDLSRNTNFVKAYGTYFSEKCDAEFLMLKYVEGKQIGEIINSRDYYFEDLIDYAYQIFSALDFLKSKDLFLPDMSDENILVDEENIVKFIDFGSVLPQKTIESLCKAGHTHEESLLRTGYCKLGILMLKMYNISLFNELLKDLPPEERNKQETKDWLAESLKFANSVSDYSTITNSNIYMYSPVEREIRKKLKKDVKKIIRSLLWFGREGEDFNTHKTLNLFKEIHRQLDNHNCSLMKAEEQECSNKKSGELSDKGVSLYNVGKFEEAVECYNKALELNQENDKAWTNKGNALHELGQYKEELVCLNKALEINPFSGYAWTGKGSTLSITGNHKEAFNCFNKALKLYPKMPGFWNIVGNACGRAGDHEKAIEYFDKALKDNPEDATVWANKGVDLGELGRYEEAIECFDKAVEINSKLSVVVAKSKEYFLKKLQGALE